MVRTAYIAPNGTVAYWNAEKKRGFKSATSGSKACKNNAPRDASGKCPCKSGSRNPSTGRCIPAPRPPCRNNLPRQADGKCPPMTAANRAASAAKARATRSASTKPCKDGQVRVAGRCPPKPCRNNFARNASGRCPPISQGERMTILDHARVTKAAKRQALITSGIHPTQVAPCRPSYGGKPRVRMASGREDPKSGLMTYACKVLKGSKRGNIGATHWPRPNTAFFPSPSTSTVTANFAMAGPSGDRHGVWKTRKGEIKHKVVSNAQAAHWGWTRYYD